MEGSVETVAPGKDINAENEILKQNGASEEPVVSTNGAGDETKEEDIGTKRKSLEGAGDHVESKKLKSSHRDEEEEDKEDENKETEEKDDVEEETSEDNDKVDKENVPEPEEKAKSLDDPVAASGEVEQQEATC